MMRSAAKDRRRLELIDATITAIARHGLVGTTLADIAKAAGVGYGVVNFYFKSKDALLLATLAHLAEEYEALVDRAVAKAGAAPAAKLDAVIAVDFSQSVAAKKKIAAWTAFWSESRSRPAFQKRCIELQDSYYRVTRALCREIAEVGGYGEVDAGAVATALNALVNGLWVEMQIRGSGFGRERARQVCRTFLASVFPREFGDLARSAA